MTYDQRQLKAFLAVVQHGSLGRAATSLALTQPALSRTIQNMEIRLGAQLFDRSVRGMELTSYGEALLPHARLLLFEMQQASDAIEALRGVKRGVARIGAVATVARSILPPAVDRMLRKAPGIHVELLEAADERLVTALVRREVDLMIASELAPSEDIMSVNECRFDDNYEVFCSSSHPLASKPVVSLNDVMHETWAMPPRGETPRELFEAQIARLELGPAKVAVETWSPSAILSFVSATNFLGWLPIPLFSHGEKAGLVRRLEVPALKLSRKFFLYRRSRGVLSAAAVAFALELPLLTKLNEGRLSLGLSGAG